MKERGAVYMALNDKEKLFAAAYIKNTGNAYQAALDAGYAPTTAKNAYEWLLKNLPNPTAKRHLPYKPELDELIKNRMAEIEKSEIADGDEVLKYLTSVMRSQSEAEVVVVEGTGEGCSEARLLKKSPDEKEKLKAAELLGKVHMLFTEKVEQQIDMDLKISIDYGEE